MEAVFARLLSLLQSGQATVAAKVGAEAGGLAVDGRQAGVDATGQGGVSGLAGERLDADLQGDALGDVGDGEYVLGRRLGKLPHQIFVSSTDPVEQRG